MMQKGFSQVNKRLDNLEEGQANLEYGQEQLGKDFETLASQVAKIENDLQPKIEAALDGY